MWFPKVCGSPKARPFQVVALTMSCVQLVPAMWVLARTCAGNRTTAAVAARRGRVYEPRRLPPTQMASHFHHIELQQDSLLCHLTPRLPA